MGYLDSAGLAHFWEKVRSGLSGKQDALTPDGSVKLQGGSIGVALPTKAVTKAEYDALTKEEKQADIMYLVDEPAWEPVPLSIQEYDTEDGWHVRKWSDGYLEMWYFGQTTVSGFENQWATNLHFTKLCDSLSYPLPVTTRYDEYCHILEYPTNGSNRFVFVQNKRESAQSTNEYMLAAGNTIGVGDYKYSISVTGRWK